MTDIPEINVGPRLRALRERRGLSMRALSEQCGLSVNAISQIERSENSPTVSSLHRLATALHVPISDLFVPEAKQTILFVKQGLGLQSQNHGVLMESLGLGLDNQQLGPFRLTVDPRAGNLHEPATHPGEEFIHCIEGCIEYSISDQVYQLEKADSLLFEAIQPHAYYNPTQEPAVILMVFSSTPDRQLVHRLHLK